MYEVFTNTNIESYYVLHGEQIPFPAPRIPELLRAVQQVHRVSSTTWY